MERVCFLLRVRPDRLDEYRERHRAVWPEMRDALSATGWRNYSLFLRDDGLLVGYLETDDFAAAQRAMEDDRRQRALAGRDGRVLRAAVRRAAGHGLHAPSGDLPPCLTRPPTPRWTSGPRAAASSSAAWTASGSTSRSSTASPTGRCACRTGCGGTCSRLFTETLDGLRRAAEAAPSGALAGVGVDAWGVDYALLDAGRRVLGLPFHYRDGRTDGMVARAHERVPAADLYGVTGIQTMPINTVFQLLADEGSEALAAAEHIALVPDLISLWLTGELRNEATAASTTGLLDARTGGWARGIADRLGLPAAPFAGATTEPGATIGAVLDHHAEAAGGAAGAPVHAVAGHDTASAFAAVPLRDGERAAVLSSGTWSLLGLELDAPVLDERARAYNLTNERGIEGTIRLLRNVMGLWLVQECRRQWEAEGGPGDYDAINRLATEAREDVALFDPDADGFLAPGDMPGADRRGVPRERPGAAGDARRDRPRRARLARVQVPPRPRAPRAHDRPRGRRRPRHRRRRAGRAPVPPDRRRPRPPRPRRAGRGDGAGQRARPGPRGRRARLAATTSAPPPRPRPSRRSTSPPRRATPPTPPTSASST